jgi:hypothetical protein
MPRPVTLFTGQWADLPFEEVCRLTSEWGFDGLEIASWGDHFDVVQAVEERNLDLKMVATDGTPAALPLRRTAAHGILDLRCKVNLPRGVEDGFNPRIGVGFRARQFDEIRFAPLRYLDIDAAQIVRRLLGCGDAAKGSKARGR